MGFSKQEINKMTLKELELWMRAVEIENEYKKTSNK